MALPLLAMLGLVTGQTLAGVEYVYNVEVVTGGKAQASTMTISAEGARGRFEGSQLPFVMVMNDERQEATWAVPKKSGCYRLPYDQLQLLQVKAIEKFKADVAKNADLDEPDRVKLLAQAQSKIDELRALKPKKRLYTWQKRSLFGEPCEMYAATEDGVEVGRACVLVEGRPTTFEVTVGPGEWWQGMVGHLAAGRVLVYFEGSRAGVVTHRATLASKKKKALDPSLLNLGTECRSGLEM